MALFWGRVLQHKPEVRFFSFMAGSKKGESHQKAAIVRFLNKITFNNDTYCWEYLSLKNPKEYPKIRVNNLNIKASKFSYETYIGELPIGLLICHKCDNPRCVSPFHIFAGSHFDNMKDARDKGRKPDGAHPSQKTYKAGCRCNECKELHSKIWRAKWQKYKIENKIISKNISDHGTPSYYSNKKCRCELCVEAHKEYNRAYFERNYDPEKFVHGKQHTYKKHKCRCGLCCAAHNEHLIYRQANRKDKKKVLP